MKYAYRITVCMTARQGPWFVEQLIADGAGGKVSNGNKIDFQESSKLSVEVNTKSTKCRGSGDCSPRCRFWFSASLQVMLSMQ